MENKNWYKEMDELTKSFAAKAYSTDRLETKIDENGVARNFLKKPTPYKNI